jgi:hypothetical protein
MKSTALAFLIIILLISACSPGVSPTPAPVEVDTPYPAPGTPFVYVPAYPMDDPSVQFPDVPFVIPSPESGRGVIVGHVVDRNTGEDLSFQTIYLASKIPFSDGEGYSIAIQERSSPNTMSDKQGRFAIGEIQPGEYFIMIWTPMDASVVIDPKTGSEMEIIIEAGQVLDVGTVGAVDPLKVHTP